MTPQQFIKWQIDAKPGDRVIYHVGTHLNPDTDVNRVAWDSAANGLVALVQRRASPGVTGKSRFEYIAERLSPNDSERMKRAVARIEAMGCASPNKQGRYA